jgi:hypothetical protein
MIRAVMNSIFGMNWKGLCAAAATGVPCHTVNQSYEETAICNQLARVDRQQGDSSIETGIQ